jgi:cell division transport system permease protein
MSLLGHILRRALRSFGENLYLNSVATAVIACALLLLGVMVSLQTNLSQMVESWSRDVHISAYFLADVPEARRFAVRERVARDPRVAQVRYVSEEEAQEWLAEKVEGLEPALQELGPGTLPASLEITLHNGEDAKDGSFDDLLPKEEFEEVDMGQDWVVRFNTFLGLLKTLAASLGALVMGAALFLVTNTVHLVIYNRRDEVEIEKLVGATPGYIVAPFLIEGMVQGLVGAALAVAGLRIFHEVLVGRLESAIQLGMTSELQFIPLPWVGILMLVGLLVGLGASTLAVLRFLASAP